MRLPHSFCKPCAGGPLSKMILDKMAQTANLFDSIFVGDGNQNRFVKSSANDLHLAARDERPNALDVLRMLFGQPFQERTGVMQPQTDARVTGHTFHKRQVGTLISAFHYVIEVADRLVRVNEQNQVEFRQERTSRPRGLSMITRVVAKGEIQMHDSAD